MSFKGGGGLIPYSPHGGLFGSGGLFVKMGFGGGAYSGRGLFGNGSLINHLQ